MKILLLIFSLFSFYSTGQEEVSWTVDYNEAENELVVSAKLANGWHIYSQFMDENAGPIPTSFEITGDNIELKGNVNEPKPTEVYDENFGSDIAYFSGEATFTQKISPDSKGLIHIEVVYMLCNDEGCLPPTVSEFEIEI